MERIVGDDAHTFATEARQRDAGALAKTRFQFKHGVFIDERRDDALHVVHLGALFGQDRKDIVHIGAGTRGHRRVRRRFAVMARQVGEKALERGEHFLFGIDNLVDEAGNFGMHAPAAEFFEIDFRAERHFDQTRTRHRHRRAFLHHREIGEAREPCRRAERRADDRSGERGLARAAELRVVVAKQHPHATRTHRVGQARAGRFADDNERHAALGRGAFHVTDFLAVGRAGRCALDREVVDDDRDITAGYAREAGELAVGLCFGCLLGIYAGRAEQT